MTTSLPACSWLSTPAIWTLQKSVSSTKRPAFGPLKYGKPRMGAVVSLLLSSSNDFFMASVTCSCVFSASLSVLPITSVHGLAILA